MTKDLLEQARSFCAYQERCHKEVRQKLLSLSFSGDDLEEAISQLISEDFLNEERFARSYCRGKFRINQWGRLKIIRQLQQKEVSAYCIKKGLEEIDESEYLALFRELFLKKWTSLSKEKNHWTKKGKVRDYMMGKGFEPELIYRQINNF